MSWFVEAVLVDNWHITQLLFRTTITMLVHLYPETFSGGVINGVWYWIIQNVVLPTDSIWAPFVSETSNVLLVYFPLLPDVYIFYSVLNDLDIFGSTDSFAIRRTIGKFYWGWKTNHGWFTTICNLLLDKKHSLLPRMTHDYTLLELVYNKPAAILIIRYSREILWKATIGCF